MFRKNTIVAAALGATALIGVVGATAASASTTRGTITATTRITDRLDSGGGGNWAYDTMTGPGRVLAVTYLGDAGPAGARYQYEATVTDNGTFKTIPGAFTPNQGGRYAGQTLRSTQVSGRLAGYADYMFDASARANSPRTFANSGVPVSLRGPAQNALYPTSTWPELAFPGGTTVTGLALYSWGWTYTVPASVTVANGHRHTHKAQTWTDSVSNGAGQYQRDGNITG